MIQLSVYELSLQCHLEGYKQLRGEPDGVCLGLPCLLNKPSKVCSSSLAFHSHWQLQAALDIGPDLISVSVSHDTEYVATLGTESHAALGILIAVKARGVHWLLRKTVFTAASH